MTLRVSKHPEGNLGANMPFATKIWSSEEDVLYKPNTVVTQKTVFNADVKITEGQTPCPLLLSNVVNSVKL